MIRFPWLATVLAVIVFEPEFVADTQRMIDGTYYVFSDREPRADENPYVANVDTE